MTALNETLSLLEAEWCALLGVPTASYDDDFFESGGDSLLAIQLAERLESAGGLPFPLAALFGDGRFGALVDEYQRTYEQEASN